MKVARARKPPAGEGAVEKAERAGASEAIDRLLAAAAHPRHAEIQAVRAVFLAADPSIREGIKWNSVSFRNQSDFFATVHLRSTAALQLVLHAGVKKKATAETGVPVEDPGGLIERWLARDRCLVTLGSGATFAKNRRALSALVKAWIRFV